MNDATCKIWNTPVDVHQRLDQLGLKKEAIDYAIRRGLLARLECTPNHPVTAPGFHGWSGTVCGLRDSMLPTGWERDNEANQGLVVNPANSVTIAVVPGDHNTGRKDAIPTTRSPRGPMTDAAVQSNSYFLFHEMEEDQIAALAAVRRDFWLLMVYVSEDAQRVQYELSRPIQMSEGKRPIGWSERILFSDFTFGEPLSRTEDAPQTPKSPEIVVEVKRRA
jgi:hypothetical protein